MVINLCSMVRPPPTPLLSPYFLSRIPPVSPYLLSPHTSCLLSSHTSCLLSSHTSCLPIPPVRLLFRLPQETTKNKLNPNECHRLFEVISRDDSMLTNLFSCAPLFMAFISKESVRGFISPYSIVLFLLG